MTSPQASTRRRGGSILDPHSSSFALFSDTLWVGVMVAVASIPVVTSFAAVSAGVETLREARERDGSVTLRAFGGALLDRLRHHWPTHLVLPAIVLAALVLNVVVLPYTGADSLVATVASAAVAALAGAVALRVAGSWRRGLRAREVFAIAWRRMSEDAYGSLLLACGVTAAGAIVVISPLLGVIMAGPLVLAAVAIDAVATSKESATGESEA